MKNLGLIILTTGLIIIIMLVGFRPDSNSCEKNEIEYKILEDKEEMRYALVQINDIIIE
jgi:hypothetical protein